jgi:hypothetical protein
MIHDHHHHHHSTPNHCREQLLVMASKQAQQLHRKPNNIYCCLGAKFLYISFVLIFYN